MPTVHNEDASKQHVMTELKVNESIDTDQWETDLYIRSSVETSPYINIVAGLVVSTNVV